MRALTTPLVLLSLAATGCTDDAANLSRPVTAQPAAHTTAFPAAIPLPTGFSPEGIDFGRGGTFYVGSIFSGAIFRGDAPTGTGDLVVPAHPERSAAGLKYDPRGDRLFVAGGYAGGAYVYDATSGATLAAYQLTVPGPELINDVIVAHDAAFFTNSSRAVIYRVPLGPNGSLPEAGEVQEIPLAGDFVFVPDAPNGNANGIVATPNGKELIVVNTTTGALYVVDPRTGRATTIDLGNASVPGGDGLVLIGRTLYVVQGEHDQIAVVSLSADLRSGTIERVITDPALRFPSTAARFGDTLYVVNARFDAPLWPDVDFDVVRVPR